MDRNLRNNAFPERQCSRNGKKRGLARLLPFAFCLLPAALAANPIEDLTGKLQKQLGEKDMKIAVLEFSYADGRDSSGGKIIQERIITSFSQNKDFTLIERSILEKVLGELRLGASGAVKESDIKKIGEIAGADYVLSGTLNDIGDGKTEVNARVIETASARVLAGARCEVEKTWKDGGSAVGGGQGGDYEKKPLIQIALLLDTSNSMDGLINQAKNQLWKIVNELYSGEKDGPGPRLEVALYEYGNSGLQEKDNFVRQVLPFTSDIDAIAKELFALKTNGGNEYCGAVIDSALRDLKWSKKDDVYKAVFIAGNEPFTQGPVDFRISAGKARKSGIFVNTIFCGARQMGVATQWLAAAEIAGGNYENIDQNANVVRDTPYDDRITELNGKLNDTYVYYGRGGAKQLERKREVDKLSFSSGGKAVMADRAVAKAAAPPAAASSWDVVSAVESGKLRKDEIKKKDLPGELKKMDDEELEKYIDGKIAERKKIKKEIMALQEKRRRYVEKMQNSGSGDLGMAVIKAIRSQAESKGFKFKK